ncbi:MAG: hypothetical protein H6974_15175 [Gammaproteobacteria bacterium]|nr:hypothetical protein [Gammaproteobacteria bacterium]
MRHLISGGRAKGATGVDAQGVMVFAGCCRDRGQPARCGSRAYQHCPSAIGKPGGEIGIGHDPVGDITTGAEDSSIRTVSGGREKRQVVTSSRVLMVEPDTITQL